VIQICKNCGAVNSEAVQSCCFCDEPFAEHQAVPAARAASASSAPASSSAPTQGNLAVQPSNWRYELAGRVEAYRERRRQLFPDDSQVALPFEPEAGEGERLVTPAAPRRAALLSPDAAEPQMYRSLPLLRPGAHGVERMEIAVTQPDLDQSARELHPGVAKAGEDDVIPVASLQDRRTAGILDALFLLLAYAGFLALFRAFGGRLIVGKFDAIVSGATLIIFYAQYFTLFTVLGGSTPGMMLRKLRVVSFDGSDPTPRQLLWRSFGYLISGGTALLGFLWAVWDEDHLTWQDRISQTYLTPAPASESDEHAESRIDLPNDPTIRPGVQWRRRDPS
jgi:uncharacterized RDD family membrane protein YckC